MIIDISKAIDSLKAAKREKTTTKKKTAKKSPVESVVLGDVNRLVNLPDVMSIEFLEEYTENLDELLYPYVSSKVMTIGYASRYKDVIIENIFGNEQHLGIYHYLREKNQQGMSDKELVAYAEKLLSQGWHIRQEGPQYWLVNVDFTKIIELTGPAPLAKEIASLVFDEASAHIFLNESVASRFGALARTIGQDADELAASGNLDLLLTRVTDNKFGGYIINYTAWRNILKKHTKYETLTEGVTPLDLYEQGFRLDNRITYPAGENAILTNGSKKFMSVPVRPEVSLEVGLNNYQLACIAAKAKKELLSVVPGVVVQEIQEIKELRHTFALLIDYWDSPSAAQTVSDSWDVLRRIQAHVDDGAVSEGFATKLMEALCAIFVTEAVLLGDAHTTLAKIATDSISGNVYSYNGLNYFSQKLSEIDLRDVEEPTFSNIPLLLSGSPVLSGMISRLPKKFIGKLSGYELDTKDYPGEFAKLRDYFSQARELVLSKAR